ncbi:unnamed protein product [Lampetra planeri]
MENSTISGGARKPWEGATRDPVWTRRFGKRALLNCCLVRWTVALLNPKKAGCATRVLNIADFVCPAASTPREGSESLRRYRRL